MAAVAPVIVVTTAVETALTAGAIVAIVLGSVSGAIAVANTVFQAYRGAQNEIEIENILIQEENQMVGKPFKKLFKWNDQVINFQNQSQELTRLFRNERVVKVKRCCRSLFNNWFPSGIFSPITVIFTGQALRHEYIVLYTELYVILIEVAGQGSTKSNCRLNFFVYDAPTQQRKKEVFAKIQKSNKYSRKLRTVKNNEIDENLTVFKIYKLLNVWTLLRKKPSNDVAKGDEYNLTWKNCKTLARSLTYFSYRNLDYSKVIDSLYGIFSDKPGNIPNPLSLGIEYITWNVVIQGFNIKDIKSANQITRDLIDQCKE